MSRKSQITVIEISLVLFLFASYLLFVGPTKQIDNPDVKLRLETLSDSILKIPSYRDVMLTEDLNSESLENNFTSLNSLLQSELGNYELIIENDSFSKKISSCDALYSKVITQRILVSSNGSYDFRKITLGVCN